MEDVLMSEDGTEDEDDQKQIQSGDTRKSERKKRPRIYYSPERTDGKKRRNGKRNGNSVTGPNRKCDLLPNGEPFSCGRCGSPYVVNKRSKTSLKNCHSRHRPLPHESLDPLTGKKILICNQCYLVFVKKKSKKTSWVKKPDPSVKEEYIRQCKAEALEIANRLMRPEANRLYCPEYTKEPCGCIQKYIRNQGNPVQADLRAKELCDLLQKATELSKLKCYQLPELCSDDKQVKKNARKKIYVGLGNGHKRSRAFEVFVLEKRQYLRDVMKLCERGSQRVLMYSNNFLHKRLKTEEDSCRLVMQRNKRTMGLLTAFEDFSKNKCCVDCCVKMADTHRRLLMDWRERAKKSQSEARRVIAEMLIPSAGCRRNCYSFINMVTGSSRGIISKVNQQMLWTGGDREPPEHGLVKYKRTHSSKSKVHTHPAQKPKVTTANVSTTIKPRLEMNNTYVQPDSGLVQGAPHPHVQTFNTQEPRQAAMTSTEPQQQQLLQLQQIFEHQQQQLIQQQLLQHTLLNEKMESSTTQNVITIQQLMDQMSAQVMNTQLQLQQSLQQLIGMGTQSNQSAVPTSTVNQNKLLTQANQHQKNSQLENPQIIPFYPMAVHSKNTTDQENMQEISAGTLNRQQPTEEHSLTGQSQQPVYIQVNTAGGQGTYIQGFPQNQTSTNNQAGALVYSSEHSTFIPYNQTSIHSGNSTPSVVTSGNLSVSQTANGQNQTAAMSMNSLHLNSRKPNTSSAFVTVSKPSVHMAASNHNVVQPSQITIVYPGCNTFVKQCVPRSKSSVVTETVANVPKNVASVQSHSKSQTFSIAPSAKHVISQNVGKQSSVISTSSATLNTTNRSKVGGTPQLVPSEQTQQMLNDLPQSSDKVIQVHAISDPSMLLKLLEQTPGPQTQTPVSANLPCSKSVPVSTTLNVHSVNARMNFVTNAGQENAVVQGNPTQVIQVSNVQTGISGMNQPSTPPSYTYIINPTVPSVQPLSVDLGHQTVVSPSSMGSNTLTTPSGAADFVNPSTLGLATPNPQNSQLVAIDPNLLIRLCQQAFSYQALDPSKGKAKKIP
ncbi:uncharacterized protein LOC133172875 [Saccostrea echinata]|uniref:uncharacterized protein LOC133172875 n=1 Tax=Saccostrea echinata TaxID=191078 RepID=UPI002A804901|nr:uncharacterized protein LOC133172875 [Saccostrea echinata]